MLRLTHVARRRTRIAWMVAVALLPDRQATAATVDATPGYTAATHYHVEGATPELVSPVAVQFATAADLDTFQTMSKKARAMPTPDARRLANAFLRERLHVEGDACMVAHFATAEDRARGAPDHALPLTDALMEAFPDHSRHSFFAGLSDGVGGILAGGRGSPSLVPWLDGLVHGGDAKHAFANVGRFLWSRTGPGYLYDTFFAPGNVVETVGEDARPLDEAFDVYRSGGFTSEYASPLRVSQLVEVFAAPGAFAELPYVRKLKDDLDRYWQQVSGDWPVLARYEFVQQARRARDTGELSESSYRLVMRGGAPRVPLTGSLTLAQLAVAAPDTTVRVRRFDINGYAASDLVRFIAADGSEVLYIPGGEPSFVVARNESELRAWALAQAKDAEALDALLAHFSVYDGQDGLFWTGVKHGLENLADGQWKADGATIDRADAIVAGDVFDDMRAQMEKRLRDDARVQASTAWEAWRTTIDRGATLLAPLGFLPPLAIPVQVLSGVTGGASGIEQAIDGRTAEDRKSGAEGAVSTVLYSVPLGTVFHGVGKERGGAAGSRPEEVRPAFVPPREVNGRVGYPLGPTVPPGWQADLVNRLYRRRDGTPGLWVAAEAEQHMVRLPQDAALRTDGVLVHDHARFVQLIIHGRGLRAARVLADAGGWRLRLHDGSAGPRLQRRDGGTWELAFEEHDYLDGSVLAEIVRPDFTADPRTLHRAATVLAQFGLPEATLGARVRTDGDANAAEPLLVLALGHAFIETLPARLRDTTAVSWSLRELALLAPVMANEAGTAIALYRADGTFHSGVAPDGTEVSAHRVPADALRLQRRGNHYFVLGPRSGQSVEYASAFAAVAENTPIASDGAAATAALREVRLRHRLAASLESASSRSHLARMHRLWLDPVARSPHERQALRRLSRLRHALIERRDALTESQQRWLDKAGKDVAMVPSSGALAHTDPIQLLSEIVKAESALLPDGLDHLTVKDAATLADAANRQGEQWSEGDRHYVRLRHLDGRAQIVETSHDRPGGHREILAPGDAADRATGRHVVDVDGMWYPEMDLREGWTPVDPREYAETLAAVATHMPAAVDGDLTNVERVVDSIPQPLVRFVRTSLTGIEVAGDGGLDFAVQHPVSRAALTFATRVDVRGRPVTWKEPRHTSSGASATAAPAFPRPQDHHVAVPLPEGTGRVRHGPTQDPAIYEALVRAERPVSAFIGAEMLDRHVQALVNTRRLRGMLREDSHIVVVGATPDHVVTLAMPVNDRTLDLVATHGADGVLVRDLPAGTVIVDDMYGVRVGVEAYPQLVRQIARRWETEGVSMRRFGPMGVEQRESPLAFTERWLDMPIRPNLWNPRNDPISEARYVDYMRRRHAAGEAVRHAGLDWLQTRTARRDYMSYFAPPYDWLSEGKAPLPSALSAMRMHDLTEVAIGLGFKPATARAEGSAAPDQGLQPDAPKEPVRSAGG
ncbi:dermonecrotic toxin domain-containing protein [Luteibacter sp. NPDC031894]|uniref:dermonecrotic toxin domain-containing protein n=1 Tax=Luteibacter sp. NPDC031894 TaxID=3390572 RepID=UPI003D02428F